MSDLAAQRGLILAGIADAAQQARRRPDDVTLVAVSKTQPAEAVSSLIAAGQRVFGENRVQEAMGKFPDLRGSTPDLRLHLIGPLQTNKIRDALDHFDVIETIDRPKLAQALAREWHRDPGRMTECFIQVNTGEEPQKSGILPEAADSFIAYCRDELGLPVTGLMCIPPMGEEPALHFALLRSIARRHGLTGLSMGMSADYLIAIALGATHVRLGTALFGARAAMVEPPPASLG